MDGVCLSGRPAGHASRLWLRSGLRHEGQDAYQADDFMPGLRTSEPTATKDADAPPDEVFDIEAHSRLISALLGKKE